MNTCTMSKQIPKLLFVGAGNIAQSIMKGIIRAKPNANTRILATAPTSRNLDVIKNTLGCQVILLDQATEHLNEFKPDFVLLCVKPQVLISSIRNSEGDPLANLLTSVPVKSCTTLSLLAGITSSVFIKEFGIQETSLVRVMLNTAAEIGSTNVLYYAHKDFSLEKAAAMEEVFQLVGSIVIKLNDEKLMDVATGVCGSGIAFFYEMIQTISDIGVKNGLNRQDATLMAAQLSKSAGEMLLTKKSHPYQLRDEVTSPSGTTIYGLSSWHENSTGQKISAAFQSSIDRAKSLSVMFMDVFK